MVLLSDLAGNVLQGYMSTIIKLIMYVAVAAIGIVIGAKLSELRKKKKESK